MPQAAFDLLTTSVQSSLWRMGWTELRPIQSEAICAVLRTENDLIISAATAAGKTEAAFLPIISRLVDTPPKSVGALYVSPLKALINDQFRRLEELCEQAELPVHRWHGDVGQTAKTRLIKQPSGILLITPESLESLFINRSTALPRIFSSLQFVVIDELHAFVGRERGLHLRSLLHRLEHSAGHRFRIVALSATLGDWSCDYAKWIRPRESEQVSILGDGATDKTIRLKVYGYEIGSTSNKSNADEIEGDDDAECNGNTLDEMERAFGSGKNLIFANRKDDIERFADALNERSRRLGRSTGFLVHHGSLSKDIRNETEELMRGNQAYTTICSSTLELGIDIGNVKAVGQIGAPWSVNSLVQRLGRSGRRDGEASEIRLFIEGYDLRDDADLVDRLYPNLLQTIAIVELMLERWLEPPDLNAMDFSTCIQQILSVLVETGGTTAAIIKDRLIAKGAFSFVSINQLKQLLHSLGAAGLIEQMPQGDLILGIEGERIVKSMEFYSAFASVKEYAVLNAGKAIGSLPALDPPPPKDHLLLAGKRWMVIDVDAKRYEIHVVPARGKKVARFQGSGGEIHDHIRRKMRDVLLGTYPIKYLNTCAKNWLTQARNLAESSGLLGSSWHCPSSQQTLLFTWSGTKIHRTIGLLLNLAQLDCIDKEIAYEIRSPFDVARQKLEKVASKEITELELANSLSSKERRKYDNYLPECLLNESFACDALDVGQSMRRLSEILSEGD